MYCVIPRKANTLTCWQEFSIFTSVEKPFVWRVTRLEPIVGFHSSKTGEEGWCDEELFQWISYHLMVKNVAGIKEQDDTLPLKKSDLAKHLNCWDFQSETLWNSYWRAPVSGVFCRSQQVVSKPKQEAVASCPWKPQKKKNNPSRCCTTGSFIRSAWCFCINPLRPKVSFKNPF